MQHPKRACRGLVGDSKLEGKNPFPVISTLLSPPTGLTEIGKAPVNPRFFVYDITYSSFDLNKQDVPETYSE